MLTSIIGEIAAHRLHWMEPIGIGFLDCDTFTGPDGEKPAPYDDAYFAKYRDMADSEVGAALNKFRSDLVCRWAPLDCQGTATLLDVGIGDGAFLRSVSYLAWLKAYGCDINPAGIAYLIENGQLASFEEPAAFDVVTFWDSLEHIRDPRPALAAARQVALVSIPIFTDAAHAVTSRHFRPDEHFWYFTRHGFIQFADQEGFDCIDVLATETALGRDSIETFVLRRRPA